MGLKGLIVYYVAGRRGEGGFRGEVQFSKSLERGHTFLFTILGGYICDHAQENVL